MFLVGMVQVHGSIPFRMYMKCSCWEHLRQNGPVLAMFLTCSYLIPGTLAPSATITFNVNGYKLRRGDRFLPYPLLAKVSGQAQSKTICHDRFKDLYLRDFVHAGKMVWRDRYRNVELTHFQEEMMA